MVGSGPARQLVLLDFAGLSVEVYYHYKYYLDYMIRLALGLAGIQEASPCLFLIVQLQISNDVCKNLLHFFLLKISHTRRKWKRSGRERNEKSEKSEKKADAGYVL